MKNKEEIKNLQQLSCLDKHLSEIGFGIAPVEIQLHNQKIVKIFGKKIIKKSFSKNAGASEAGLRGVSFLKSSEQKKASGEVILKFQLSNGKVSGMSIESLFELDFEKI